MLLQLHGHFNPENDGYIFLWNISIH
jgi:hypothetical protein